MTEEAVRGPQPTVSGSHHPLHEWLVLCTEKRTRTPTIET